MCLPLWAIFQDSRVTLELLVECAGSKTHPLDRLAKEYRRWPSVKVSRGMTQGHGARGLPVRPQQLRSPSERGGDTKLRLFRNRSSSPARLSCFPTHHSTQNREDSHKTTYLPPTFTDNVSLATDVILYRAPPKGDIDENTCKTVPVSGHL